MLAVRCEVLADWLSPVVTTSGRENASLSSTALRVRGTGLRVRRVRG